MKSPAAECAENPEPTRLIVADRLDRPAVEGRGEDMIGATSKGAWVIDGATSLNGRVFAECVTDAMWAARFWDTFLQQAMVRPPADFLGLLEAGVGESVKALSSRAAAKGWELTPMDFPSCCLSAVWLDGGSLHGYTIGDSAVVVMDKAGELHVHYDDRVDAFDGRAVASYRDELARGQSPEQARASVKDLLRANRLRKNTEGGYWILDSNPSAVRHGISFSHPANSVAGVMLCTDGLLQTVDPFLHYKDVAALGRATLMTPPVALADVCAEIVRQAGADPDCRQFPRLKRIDDIAAMVMGLA